IGSMAMPNNVGPVPTGGSGVSDLWIPPGGFFSGYVTFTITVTMPDGSTCTSTITKYLACPHGGPVMRVIHQKDILLYLAPNPAKHTTEVTYNYSVDAKGQARTLELYDLTGRKLASYNPGENASGVWELDLEGYAAGTYQIVMKDHSGTVGTARLVVTH
ncbi:MAG: T9SS type A sorting domain-containing protein, partial [Chitinophagaceae bacterium]